MTQKFITPHVNNNGDTYKTLDLQLLAVRKASSALLYAMAQARPHGRNYQTFGDPVAELTNAQIAWEEATREVVAIHDGVGEVRGEIHHALTRTRR